jgi:hypothetical protein
LVQSRAPLSATIAMYALFAMPKSAVQWSLSPLYFVTAFEAVDRSRSTWP